MKTDESPSPTLNYTENTSHVLENLLNTFSSISKKDLDVLLHEWSSVYINIVSCYFVQTKDNLERISLVKLYFDFIEQLRDIANCLNDSCINCNARKKCPLFNLVLSRKYLSFNDGVSFIKMISFRKLGTKINTKKFKLTTVFVGQAISFFHYFLAAVSSILANNGLSLDRCCVLIIDRFTNKRINIYPVNKFSLTKSTTLIDLYTYYYHTIKHNNMMQGMLNNKILLNVSFNPPLIGSFEFEDLSYPSFFLGPLTQLSPAFSNIYKKMFNTLASNIQLLKFKAKVSSVLINRLTLPFFYGTLQYIVPINYFHYMLLFLRLTNLLGLENKKHIFTIGKPYWSLMRTQNQNINKMK